MEVRSDIGKLEYKQHFDAASYYYRKKRKLPKDENVKLFYYGLDMKEKLLNVETWRDFIIEGTFVGKSI
ncbi:hypothetical protein FRX31_016211 [Thalictrum thalictroides]|uniref:Uncharacterized protein n=1 Tax=Thalictrum thalictroides TaxID=46969 RepID=A0A7J6WB65_THATH|nr:hypothetical protein FRX31_016211 [Thalictrum thalictroides]